MKAKPLDSLDGVTHTYVCLDPLGAGRYRQLECPACNWYNDYVTAGVHDITPAKYRHWADHVRGYNLIRKLEKAPQPVFMGRWESSRKEGAVFIYRVDSKLPQPLKGWRGSDYLKYVQAVFATDMTKPWKMPWLAQMPYLIIESSGYSNQIGSEHHVFGAYKTYKDADLSIKAYLAKRETKGNTVTYAEGTEWPEGIVAPLPSVEEYVQRLLVMAQTDNYTEIVDALNNVNRGITQLELLFQAREMLEEKLCLNTTG